MGESKALPSFGQVDLDLELDLEDAGLEDAGAWEARVEPVPPSTSRVFNVEAKRPTRRNLPSVHDESTRIVHGDPLAALGAAPAGGEDGNTRAWIEIDEDESVPSVPSVPSGPSSPSSRSGFPSRSSGSSGFASGDGRVAAMRELYAKGDAEGALALAETFGHGAPPPFGSDRRDGPDASIVVEFGEQSVDLEDPFGGLILAEDDPPRPPSAAAQLTLTERQSIPRLLTSMAELSKLKLDHRAGFLLAHVDSHQTLEEILDVCAMPPAEALDLIANLKEMGVIEFE